MADVKLRVLPRGFSNGSDDQGEWISRGGKRRYDVPGGRVTLHFSDRSVNGEIVFGHISYEPIRSGLVRFGSGPSAPERRNTNE